MIKIAIIGTALRGDDKKKMTPQLYENMYLRLKAIITDISHANANDEIALISGGAACGDHLAVKYSLENKIKLFLELPATFNQDKQEFDSNKVGKTDHGNVSNYYHYIFSSIVYQDEFKSLEDLGKAIKLEDTKTQVFKGGFFHRNDSVADQADYVIAFTFSSDRSIGTGGAGYTAARFNQRKQKDSNRKKPDMYHVNLNMDCVYFENSQINVI